MSQLNKGFPVLVGATVDAAYRRAQLKQYSQNPLIESLRPIQRQDQVINKLACPVPIRESDRMKSDELRAHCIFQLTRFIEPMEHHLQIEQALSILIRDGYVDRNPLTVNGVRILREGADNVRKAMNSQNIKLPVSYKTSGSGLTIIGVSGMGKTTAVNNILMKLYPAQVIIHGQYKERNLNFKQIVWLKLECPPGGSTKGLCLNFLQALDKLLGNTNYHQEHVKAGSTVDQLIPVMAQLSATYRIGVLVVDEIQHLLEANVGGQDQMLNFFVTLKNMIGIPIVFIGTYKAWDLLNKEFRQIRRTTEHFGLVNWKRMNYDDFQWDLFIRALWKYQWTREIVPFDEQFSKLIYDYSQGITDVAVKLFMISQWRAIIERVDGMPEKITPEIIVNVAKNELKAFQPVMEAIRLKNNGKLEEYMDIFQKEVDLESILSDVLLDFRNKKSQTPKKVDIQSEEDTVICVARWLVEGGASFDQAERIVKAITNKEPDLPLPLLKNKAFQAYIKMTQKIERKIRRETKSENVKSEENVITIDFSSDIVPAEEVNPS
ncbi:ATP-binding protein [Paenibacillus sp. P26]|nr:ATP-binding protein [Paenibacillus sp. P26]UUZ93362.1 ATP-binding protein [Paenibacillus sp. P25]